MDPIPNASRHEGYTLIMVKVRKLKKNDEKDGSWNWMTKL